MKNNWFDRYWEIGLILLIALLLRVGAIGASLSYDEIWTQENYSKLSIGKIFTELELPNNQPLNTFFVKMLSAYTLQPYGIRIHSLFAGIIAIVLLWIIARTTFNKKVASWSALFFATSAPAALYSQLARGYELQLAFLLLFFTGIAISGNFRPKSLPYLPETAIIIGAVAAMLTLPTSVIFMSTGVLSCWLFMRCYPTKKMVLTMGGTGIFILSYLLSNFSKFQTGRQWGIAITSVEKFSNFVFETQQALLPFGLLILSAVGIFIPAFKQKIEYRRLWLLLIPVLVFVSSLATKAGPPRVYLPLTACYALFSGLGAVCLLDYLENYQKLNRIAKLPMILLLVTIAVFGYFSKYNDPQWRLPDWKKIFSDISTNVPIETFVVYRSNDSFPVLQNNAPQIYRDHLRRMSNRSENRLLLMFDAVGNFNVANPEQSEWVCHYSTVKPIKQLAFDNTVATLYQMKRLRKPSELQLPVVAFIGPVATSTIQSIASELNCQRILELNIWLNTVTRNVNGIQYRAVALLLSPEHISANLFKRLQPYGEAVALYQVQ